MERGLLDRRYDLGLEVPSSTPIGVKLGSFTLFGFGSQRYIKEAFLCNNLLYRTYHGSSWKIAFAICHSDEAKITAELMLVFITAPGCSILKIEFPC